MAQQRKALWEADLDEDLQDVDLNFAIGNFGQNGQYDDGASASGFLKDWPSLTTFDTQRSLG